MVNIMVVEDEKPISNLIALSLKKAGYHSECAYDGLEAIDMLEKNYPDLILLDIMLPGADGFEILEYVKPLEIPVIFLTAKGDLNDRVNGLRYGAEDYIVKPFEIMELLARIEVVLRRYHKLDRIINILGLEIDTDAMCVKKEGKEINLTKKEYDTLLLFARNPGNVLFREIIYERVWGGDYIAGSRTVSHLGHSDQKIFPANFLSNSLHMKIYRPASRNVISTTNTYHQYIRFRNRHRCYVRKKRRERN